VPGCLDSEERELDGAVFGDHHGRAQNALVEAAVESLLAECAEGFVNRDVLIAQQRKSQRITLLKALELFNRVG
jgi:hypothetical protein